MREYRRLRSVITGTAASAALVAGSLVLAAAPAHAAVSGYANGTVGVTQVINAQGICPSAQLSLQAQYSNGVTSTSDAVYADINGNATIYWTPSIAGQVTQAIIGSTCTPVALGSATISQATTTTTVSAPNNAKVGQATQITVTVQSQSPSSYAPTGQVVVKDVNGATLQTMGLTPGPGNGQAYAYYWWTPQTAGTYTFQATYGGDTNAKSSVSPQDFVVATPSGNPITLTNPAQMTQGVPVTLTATVYPVSVQGSVGFTLNGQPISASVPLVNGVATFTWTPNTVGTVTLGANYTTNQGGTGSTTNQVTIVAGPASNDVITLVQPGWGAWSPNGTYTLGNGSNFAFQASTLSGAPVTLSETGPCAVNGLTITVPTGSGQCNLVASSPGASGYAAVKYGYTVTLIPGNQTATVAAPLSGRVQLKKSYVLEAPGQGDTNAGQNIVWSVKKSSKSVCKLAFPSNGSVTVKLVKRGQCTVYGKAPGVPGQWNPYQITRTYRA